MILKCQCCCSCLEVEYDEELQNYNFTCWNRHGMSDRLSIKERFRWCWNVLKTGDPWSDHTLISKEDFEELRTFNLENENGNV